MSPLHPLQSQTWWKQNDHFGWRTLLDAGGTVPPMVGLLLGYVGLRHGDNSVIFFRCFKTLHETGKNFEVNKTHGFKPQCSLNPINCRGSESHFWCWSPIDLPRNLRIDPGMILWCFGGHTHAGVTSQERWERGRLWESAIDSYMRVSINGGTPIWVVPKRKIARKIMIWGYLCFRKAPCWVIYQL